jgi:hypothetical protein
MKKPLILVGLVLVAGLAVPVLVLLGWITVSVTPASATIESLSLEAGNSLLLVQLEGDLPPEGSRAAKEELDELLSTIRNFDGADPRASGGLATRVSSTSGLFSDSLEWEYLFDTPPDFDSEALKAAVLSATDRHLPKATVIDVAISTSPSED